MKLYNHPPQEVYYCVIFYCIYLRSYVFARGINSGDSTFTKIPETVITKEEYEKFLSTVSKNFDFNLESSPSLGKDIFSILESGSIFYERDIYILKLDLYNKSYEVVTHLNGQYEIQAYRLHSFSLL